MKLLLDANQLLKSKVKGKNFAMSAISVLVQIQAQVKVLKNSQDEECAPFKGEIAKIQEKYKSSLATLSNIDSSIREKVEKEYGESETLESEEGLLIFPERWDYSIEDISKVPREFMCDDRKEIMEAVKNGVRSIKGLEIKRVRGLQVRTKE